MNANKRRKVSSSCDGKDIQTGGLSLKYPSHTLTTLPPEVLEMILRFLPFKDVASAVRLVCRQCSIVATTVLNSAFFALDVRLGAALKHAETALSKAKIHGPKRMETLYWTKTYNYLELIRAQYKMLRAVTWRYTHPHMQKKFPRLCFYAGSLLDDMDNFVRKAVQRPFILSTSLACCCMHVLHFVTLCKRFMNYFEKISERRVNRSVLVSGCKTVDILDCLTEGREVLSYNVTPCREIVTMKLRYIMKRSWFTCLDVPRVDDENSWRDEQRFMYLRLRRLVESVNEHLLEKLHYDKVIYLLTQAIPMSIPKPPPASTYSGYGEYGGRFFYYGNMNKYAYASKFKFPGREEDTYGDTTEEMQPSNSHFDVVITIELKCSPELAPFAIRGNLRLNDLETNEDITTNIRKQFYLKLNVNCPASVANRLPGNFTWELRNSRRGH